MEARRVEREHREGREQQREARGVGAVEAVRSGEQRRGAERKPQQAGGTFGREAPQAHRQRRDLGKDRTIEP